jgi:outer membrane lipoprotein-sorting protein
VKPIHTLALFLAIFLLPVITSAEENPTLNSILQKHLEAMGGLNNWIRVESIQLSGTIERYGQTANIVIIKKRPNQIRATVTIPIPGKEDQHFQIIRAHDGKTAWSAKRLAGAPEMIKEELSKEAANELLDDAGVMPRLIKYWREGAQLKQLPPQKINGERTFVIQATPKGSSTIYTFHVSEESYLITQYESTHPEHGTTQTLLSNYKMKQGVQIPMLNIIQAEQTGKSVLTTRSIKIGVGIYEEYFKLGDRANTAKL